jgi:diaminohydroxyphosphoribosylaminopyrimidine deaminase/5-amino-6-(5-phosphoribosylamino)uracil reductase
VIEQSTLKMEFDHGFFMRRCLDLAKLGAANVFPNPMVGCVIVHEGKIIGEGYHQKYGEAHAEVNAINTVKHPELLPKSTVYVSLEPCAHYGKTPPCALLLIQKKVQKVVIGCRDSYTEVDGKGIELLKNAGIEVSVGILEDECIAVNKRFFTFHNKNRPFITLKWAQSEDGFFAPHSNQGIHWITSESTQIFTHSLRAKEHAILVGINTVLIDNPSLDVRAITGRSPIRIVIDSALKIKESKKEIKLIQDKQPTIVLNASFEAQEGNVHYKAITPFTLDNCLIALHKMNILSILIEGGATTLNYFITAGLWDEAFVLQGQKNIENGLIAPIITDFSTQSHEQFTNGDQLTHFVK